MVVRRPSERDLAPGAFWKRNRLALEFLRGNLVAPEVRGPVLAEDAALRTQRQTPAARHLADDPDAACLYIHGEQVSAGGADQHPPGGVRHCMNDWLAIHFAQFFVRRALEAPLLDQVKRQSLQPSGYHAPAAGTIHAGHESRCSAANRGAMIGPLDHSPIKDHP